MKLYKKFLLVIIAVLVLSGCIGQKELSDDEKRMLGTWKGESDRGFRIISFSSDGSGYIISSFGKNDMTWEIEDKILCFVYDNINSENTYNYLFDKITTNGNETITAIYLSDITGFDNYYYKYTENK